MQKFYKPARMALIISVLLLFLTVYVSALYKMQIYDAQPSEQDLYPRSTSSHTVTLAAARGNIYDRNGILLASSRPSYNIVLSRRALLDSPNMNDIIHQLVYTAAKNGVKYNDSFPITPGAPFSFLSDMSPQQRDRLYQYIDWARSWSKDIPQGSSPSDLSASDLFNWMKTHYDLDYTTGISDARLIIGVRYELEIRAVIQTLPQYVFAEDVGADFVAFIEEHSFPGVYIETSSVRVYHTNYAAHVLGFTRAIDKDDYDRFFTQLKYPLDALVGKTGAELAFEEFLHGTDGSQIVTTSDSGAVVDVKTIAEPIPGDNVYLTLDISLQKVAEDALNSHINSINHDREENQRVTGGAVVVTDINSGSLLASASAPTFDLSALSSQYLAQLNSDLSRPLWNRATQGTYNPGSTFKMVTAYAGLKEGIIGRWTPIFDTGIFTETEGFSFKCWIYNETGYGHGSLDVVGALENSCNYFFNKVGKELGFRPIANAATEFGFGQYTGLELSEKTGNVATREYKLDRLGEGWWDADTLMSAIGQSHNYFTPVQLANYVATIANNGTRYSLTILNKIKSNDFSELLFSKQPAVANIIPESDFIQYLQEGMRAVARGSSGTAARVFADYPIPVAAKTGTVQSDDSAVDDAVFVCYAPADNPEIAVAIVVEKGTSGSSIMEIAKDIFDYYFAPDSNFSSLPEAVLIP